MSVITIPRILRDKLGEDGADALANLMQDVERDARGELSTKADIKELEGKLKELEGKMKLYFIVLLFAIVLLNPNALEIISKLLGVVK